MSGLTKKDIGGFLARQGILVAFVLFIIGFTIANARFLDPDNIMGVVRSSAILGVMALGVTFVVISGNLDLSVGSMMSFSTIVVLDLHDKIGPALAIPAMFAMTLCLGAFIGFLVGYLKLNSLIVTLGMLSAIHGLTLTYSGGKNMDIADKEGTWFSVFGQGEALGFPVPILIFVLLAAAFVPEHAGLVLTGLYLLGFVIAVLSALAFKHLLGQDSGSAAMELPAYRLPPVRLVLRLAWLRTRAFLAGAGGPILVAVVAVWALLTLQLPGGTSVFEAASRALAPLFAPLGFGDWRVVGALIPGAVAKEVVIGSLALTFTGGEATAAVGLGSGLVAIGQAFLDAVQGTVTSLWGFALAAEAPDGTLGARLSGAVSTGGAIALMVFTLLYVPCVATLAAIRKAFGTHYALFSVGYQLAVAYGAAFLAFRIFG